MESADLTLELCKSNLKVHSVIELGYVCPLVVVVPGYSTNLNLRISTVLKRIECVFG